MEETYHRAYNGFKLTRDLTIAPEYKCIKEYEFRSDHFPIFVEDEREVFTKQDQRWNIGRANWMQFQKKNKSAGPKYN